jgi:hypothetical protein
MIDTHECKYPEGIPFDEEEFERNREEYRKRYIAMGIMCKNGECVIRKCLCKWCLNQTRMHDGTIILYPSRECMCTKAEF